MLNKVKIGLVICMGISVVTFDICQAIDKENGKMRIGYAALGALSAAYICSKVWR